MKITCLDTEEYQTVVKDGHLIILSDIEFRMMQISEIRKFQESAGKKDNETASMWIKHYARSFRDTWSKFTFRTNETKNVVFSEIQKHRWIESEKAGNDLGIFAELDWLMKYGYLYQES